MTSCQQRFTILPGSVGPLKVSGMLSPSESSASPSEMRKSQVEYDAVVRRFAGKTVLVTGASDRGIGGAVAERFAREGASVGMLSRHEPRKMMKLLQRLSCDAKWVPCDITDPAAIATSLETIVDELGPIDVLVNNAGVESAGRLEETTEADWKLVLAVNLQGAIQVTQASLPVIKSGSVVINIASALGLGGCTGYSVYSASKAGLIGFTQSLAWELAPRGIRVVAVSPGLVHTPMVFKHAEHWTPEVRKKVEAAHPLGIGTPHDVAAAVAFLASADARWITGVNLPLGWSPNYPLPTETFSG